MSKSTISIRSSLLLGLAFTALNTVLTGCGDQQSGNGKTAVTKNDSVSRSGKTADVRQSGLTLPVLDALFFEEGFQDELKSKLQLTDAQVQELKAAARSSVSELTEDGSGDYSGSARNAAKESDAKVRGILGEEKANALFQLVNQRYASGDVEGLFPTQPNSVPADTRVVVNAPAYRMDVFQEGKLLKSYRIGIGYPEFPLPTGMRRADNIIFNPTWTPPDEPWVRGKVEAGKQVPAGSKLNPLGPIKVPIGLPSLIHGGKAAEKLGGFASHGCVGLTNQQVQDFTGLLAQLSALPISADSIRQYEKNKTKTKTVKLEKPVPVELRYETIVAENGALHIYRDVYEHGTNTLENARKVLGVYGLKYESLSPQEQATLTTALSEMNKDARGSQIVADADIPNVADAGTDSSKEEKNNPGKKEARAKKGKVTRTVTGQKEISVAISGLQGKGYPAPVNYSTGQ